MDRDNPGDGSPPDPPTGGAHGARDGCEGHNSSASAAPIRVRAQRRGYPPAPTPARAMSAPPNRCVLTRCDPLCENHPVYLSSSTSG